MPFCQAYKAPFRLHYRALEKLVYVGKSYLFDQFHERELVDIMHNLISVQNEFIGTFLFTHTCLDRASAALSLSVNDLIALSKISV
jgi:hypothetical protein